MSSFAEHVPGSEGTWLGSAGSPPAATTRWTPRRKAEILAAVRQGLLSIEAAAAHYAITPEELLSWQGVLDREGLSGLTNRRVAERRRMARRAVQAKASAIAGDHRRACMITDIGSGGARLAFTTVPALPHVFSLLCHKSRRALSVERVWQRDSSVGVAFKRPLELNGVDLGAWILGEA